jgi:hypothetical protein
MEQKSKKMNQQEVKNGEINKENLVPEASQRYSMKYNKKSMTTINNDSIDDESFLELEKMCENTLTLNNVSENFMDLTSLEAVTKAMSKKSFGINDETRLNEIEEPSFLQNSSIMSPKNSPFRLTRANVGNRPSTIMEVTEISSVNKTTASSYHTATNTTVTDKSEYYQTANETMESITGASAIINRPVLKSFYDETLELTKDSLDVSLKKDQNNCVDLTADSLNSKADSSSGIEISCDDEDVNEGSRNESIAHASSIRMNDTLEEIEFMLAQAQKMNDEKLLKTPKALAAINSLPTTPKLQSPAVTNKPSPSPWSAAKQKPNSGLKTKKALTPLSKNSPLIKFSPQVKSNSPAMAPSSNFKLPNKPVSTSKIPQFSSNSKKFSHIVSPISRYINHTPELPLSSLAHVEYGYSSSARSHLNFRDSESFADNTSLNSTYKGSSLPMRAKTKTGSVKKVNSR